MESLRPRSSGQIIKRVISGSLAGALIMFSTLRPSHGQVKAEGEYSGVRSGGKSDQRKNQKTVAKGALAWVGFAASEGAAEVFFQSPGPFEVEQRVDGGVVNINLKGLRAQARNTQRAIDTRFFDNPLSRITTSRIKGAVSARIVFKKAQDAAIGSVRTVTESDGMFYAYVTFPPAVGGTVTAPTKPAD
jgi:hypothetical protein